MGGQTGRDLFITAVHMTSPDSVEGQAVLYICLCVIPQSLQPVGPCTGTSCAVLRDNTAFG